MKSPRQRTWRSFLVVSSLVLVFGTISWAADEDKPSDIAKRLNTSAGVLNEIMGAPDSGIPDNVLGDAKCIAVVPSLMKFVIGLGGSHGKGVATCRAADGKW